MHPSMESILRAFKYEHLKEGDVRDTSRACSALAHHMAHTLPSSSEVVAGLRKLREAKDCFVLAAVWAEEDKEKPSEPANA